MTRIVVKRGPTGFEVWLEIDKAKKRFASYYTHAEAVAFAEGMEAATDHPVADLVTV